MPGYIHKKGPVGVMSRSGTLTYEAVWQLTSLGLGQSTCVGLGGDPIVGTSFVDLLAMFEADPETRPSCDGGDRRHGRGRGRRVRQAARHQAGRRVHRRPHGPARQADGARRRDHLGGKGTAADKVAALQSAGIEVAESPADMGAAMQRAMNRKRVA